MKAAAFLLLNFVLLVRFSEQFRHSSATLQQDPKDRAPRFDDKEFSKFQPPSGSPTAVTNNFYGRVEVYQTGTSATQCLTAQKDDKKWTLVKSICSYERTKMFAYDDVENIITSAKDEDALSLAVQDKKKKRDRDDNDDGDSDDGENLRIRFVSVDQSDGMAATNKSWANRLSLSVDKSFKPAVFRNSFSDVKYCLVASTSGNGVTPVPVGLNGDTSFCSLFRLVTIQSDISIGQIYHQSGCVHYRPNATSPQSTLFIDTCADPLDNTRNSPHNGPKNGGGNGHGGGDPSGTSAPRRSLTELLQTSTFMYNRVNGQLRYVKSANDWLTNPVIFMWWSGPLKSYDSIPSTGGDNYGWKLPRRSGPITSLDNRGYSGYCWTVLPDGNIVANQTCSAFQWQNDKLYTRSSGFGQRNSVAPMRATSVVVKVNQTDGKVACLSYKRIMSSITFELISQQIADLYTCPNATSYMKQADSILDQMSNQTLSKQDISALQKQLQDLVKNLGKPPKPTNTNKSTTPRATSPPPTTRPPIANTANPTTQPPKQVSTKSQKSEPTPEPTPQPTPQPTPDPTPEPLPNLPISVLRECLQDYINKRAPELVGAGSPIKLELDVGPKIVTNFWDKREVALGKLELGPCLNPMESLAQRFVITQPRQDDCRPECNSGRPGMTSCNSHLRWSGDAENSIVLATTDGYDRLFPTAADDAGAQAGLWSLPINQWGYISNVTRGGCWTMRDNEFYFSRTSENCLTFSVVPIADLLGLPSEVMMIQHFSAKSAVVLQGELFQADLGFFGQRNIISDTRAFTNTSIAPPKYLQAPFLPHKNLYASPVGLISVTFRAAPTSDVQDDRSYLLMSFQHVTGCVVFMRGDMLGVNCRHTTGSYTCRVRVPELATLPPSTPRRVSLIYSTTRSILRDDEIGRVPSVPSTLYFGSRAVLQCHNPESWSMDFASDELFVLRDPGDWRFAQYPGVVLASTVITGPVSQLMAIVARGIARTSNLQPSEYSFYRPQECVDSAVTTAPTMAPTAHSSKGTTADTSSPDATPNESTHAGSGKAHLQLQESLSHRRMKRLYRAAAPTSAPTLAPPATPLPLLSSYFNFTDVPFNVSAIQAVSTFRTAWRNCSALGTPPLLTGIRCLLVAQSNTSDLVVPRNVFSLACSRPGCQMFFEPGQPDVASAYWFQYLPYYPSYFLSEDVGVPDRFEDRAMLTDGVAVRYGSFGLLLQKDPTFLELDVDVDTTVGDVSRYIMKESCCAGVLDMGVSFDVQTDSVF